MSYSVRIRGCVRQLGFVLLTYSASELVQAQASFDFAPPHVDMTDPVGVQLNSGVPEFEVKPLGIGPAGNRLVFWEKYTYGDAGTATSGLFGDIRGSPDEFLYGNNALIVNVLGTVEPFVTGTDGLYHNWSQDGASLTVTGGSTYNFTDRNGATYTFSSNYSVAQCTWSSTFGTPSEPCAVLAQVNYPNGETLTIFPNRAAVVRNDGFAFRISGGIVQAINLAVDYCDLTQPTCSFSRTWPQATFGGTSWQPDANTIGATSTVVVTDAAGVQTRFSQQLFSALGTGNNSPLSRVVAVKAGSSSGADTTSYSYVNPIVCVPYPGGVDCNTPRPALVGQVTTGAGVWTYTYTQLHPTAPPQTLDFGVWETSATRPDGFHTTGDFNIVSGYIQGVAASNGSLSYITLPSNGANRVTGASDSEGRNFGFTYDGRGNVLSKTQVASSGGTNAVLQESYDTTCTNLVTCNKPNWVRDAKGNQTDYTYDQVHGGILTETSPADARGVRPQKRYSYVQRYAWLKNSSGGYSHAATPIWKLNTVAFCIKGTWSVSNSRCEYPVGTALTNDLVTTTYDYGPDAGPNNLLVRGQVVTADGVSHRTCYGYDVLGNKISETTPNANLASCP
jgi:YD repeat-containing protein